MAPSREAAERYPLPSRRPDPPPEPLHLLTALEQLFQRPLRVDAAVLQHEDVVGAAQHGAAMGDDQASGVRAGEDALPERALRVDIQRAGQVVADQQLGIT